MTTSITTSLKDLFAAIDRRDARAFSSHLTEDVEFHFGNAPPVHGREQVHRVVEAFFHSLDGLIHRSERSLNGDGCTAVFGTVTYLRKNGTELTVPFANLFTLEGEKVRKYQIVVDNHTLYS